MLSSFLFYTIDTNMITRCYLEITNICNLDCLFCPKTTREKRAQTLAEFDLLTDKLRGKVKFLYFHLMGEPLLHRHLPEFIVTAREKGFIPVLTTNGTLLSRAGAVMDARPYKMQVSLHSHEGNGKENLEQYVGEVMRFAVEAASKGIIMVLRLWNQGGYDKENERLLDIVAEYVPRPWGVCNGGWKPSENIFIEYGRMFEWPEGEKPENGEEESFCYALRNQIGVLVDGTVVPCCLDSAGVLNLGNLFDQSLDEVLASPRARAIYDGFTKRMAVEPLCRRCGYAALIK
ncbi:MAG: SPASM domain-containing protein [Bacteroidaceae bacterium]|nr:SPASM domain-containing protein [Bacteroidaceae bacterium]